VNKDKIDGLKYFVIDVDGTMTDAGIYYDDNGNELKKFCTKDAAAFFVLHEVGIHIVVITGRECAATKRRMAELKVDCLYQGVVDKVKFLEKFMSDNNISSEEIGYIGDDLNDYEAMSGMGFKACPADSCKEIIGIADYVSNINGGKGAVRDIIESMLRETGKWERAVKTIYGCGI
jgi:3-deoxy-D-manno-octulosonate 8-phosphate phosphatase (KDO 8-P phosphatase)